MNKLLVVVLIGYVALVNGRRTVYCPTQGKLADRLQQNIRDNDINRDGKVTAAEMKLDSDLRYDIDRDDCISTPEWVYHWMKDVKLSSGYALQRLQDILGGTDVFEKSKCMLNMTAVSESGASIPMERFVNNNLQSLVDFCDKDTFRYDSNCDCKSLPDLCRSDPFFSNYSVCITFRNDNPNAERVYYDM